MILSDRDLKRIILDQKVYLVNPFNIEDLQPCSIDLHLGDEVKRIDGSTFDLTQTAYTLKPNEFILGHTMERVNVPFDLMARVEGKSSIARLGIMVHITAGFVDAGYTGQITLEIYNCSNKEFTLFHGDPICQVAFETLTSPVETPYNGHYQNSSGTVLSAFERK